MPLNVNWPKQCRKYAPTLPMVAAISMMAAMASGGSSFISAAEALEAMMRASATSSLPWQ